MSRNDVVIGIPALITYTLIGDKLVQGATGFMDLRIVDNPQSVETTFARILSSLKLKYGSPFSTGVSPLGGLETDWRTPSTKIVLARDLKDDVPFALVFYYSRKLAGVRVLSEQREIGRKF